MKLQKIEPELMNEIDALIERAIKHHYQYEMSETKTSSGYIAVYEDFVIVNDDDKYWLVDPDREPERVLGDYKRWVEDMDSREKL